MWKLVLQIVFCLPSNGITTEHNGNYTLILPQLLEFKYSKCTISYTMHIFSTLFKISFATYDINSTILAKKINNN
jgi:hypothetical protein